MIIKKFIGKTEEEATEAAKKELGSGIVIMNVRTAKKKGLFAFLKPRQTEVTVALEEEKDTLESYRRGNSQSATAPQSRMVEKENREAVESMHPSTVNVVSDSSKNIEQKLDSLQTLLVNKFSEESGKKEQLKEQEPQQAREQESQEPPVAEKETEQDKFIRLLYNTMLDSEVDEQYANQIIDDIQKNRKPNVPIDYILANVYQKMILKFGKTDGIKPADNGPKVVLFIGPTGVGKTTTIAKVASSFVVEQKKKVALITTDTYRIAAAEQLRTYANILEVAFRVVYTPDEMETSIADFKDYDYIFVDTAGHSHQNEDQMKDMKAFLDVVKKSSEYQVLLVLSATTKYKDLLKIAASYHEVTEYGLIFTKLDETVSLGNLLNLKLFSGAEIAYVTYGQNVPDDIESFNPQKTVKQILSTRR